jgi:uncharacterized protein (DUF1501 family)
MKRSSASRRQFLGGSLAASAGLAIGSPVPGPWMQALASDAVGGERILVVIQFSGGNDGLNTVIPYSNEEYRKARPKLAISKSDVLKIDDELGLHPSLGGASKLLERGRLSIVQGVGYAAPNRSHFESMDIWHSCRRKEERGTDGWLGRWIGSRASDKQTDSLGLHLGGDQQPLALAARGVQVPSIASVDQFRLKIADEGISGNAMLSNKSTETKTKSDGDDLLGFLQASTEAAVAASERLEKALKTPDTQSEFPQTDLGEKLRVISRLILAGLSTRVYYITLDGFDTHSQQAVAHAGLLRHWSDALDAFVRRMERAGQADRVLVMTFSEFGRRVQENASEGTDHGAAAPVFFAGCSLPKPVIGKLPSLTDLDDGDLKFHTDFRSVYATVVEQWFKDKSKQVLGESYPTINLL